MPALTPFSMPQGLDIRNLNMQNARSMPVVQGSFGDNRYNPNPGPTQFGTNEQPINAVGGPAPYSSNPGEFAGAGNQPQTQPTDRSAYDQRYLARLNKNLQEDYNQASISAGSSDATPPVLQQYGSMDDYYKAMASHDISARGAGRAEGQRAGFLGEMALDEDDPYVQQFKQQFGTREFVDENGRPMQAPDSGNALAKGYVMGYGDPQYDGKTGILQDDSRIVRLPNGMYIREAGNIHGGEIAGHQRAQETDRRETWQTALKGAGLVLGGGLAANALMAGGGSIGSGAGAMPEALGGSGGVTAYPTGSVGGMGGSGGGFSIGDMASRGMDYARNSLTDANSWAQRVASNAGDLFGGQGQGTGGQMFNGAGGSPLDALNAGGGNVQTGGNTFADGLRRVFANSGQGGMGNSAGGNFIASLINYGLNRNQGDPRDFAAQDREHARQTWRENVQAARPNQYTEFGSSEWTMDPVTGQYTQRVTMNPEDKARLQQFRGIAAERMRHAGQALNKGIDWSKINPRLAAIASALPSFGGSQIGG